MNTRTAAVVLVLAAAAGAAGYFAGNRKGEAQGEAKVPQAAASDAAASKPGEIKYAEGASQLSALKMEPAVEAPLPLAEPLNGKVSYDEDVTARITTPIAGRIVDLKVAAGDTVKAGQVLANIDAPDFAAALADLRKAEADQNVKRLAVERSQKLFDAEVIARKDLEAASADYAQAQAEGQRARARLKNLNPSGDGPGLALRAPVSGVVADRKVNPSQEVQPGSDPLFVVSNLSRLWVLVDLPEKHLATVKPGLPVAVTVEAYPNESFRGVVSRVGQVVNPDTRRVQVRCDIPNLDGKLRPEMYARVILLTAEGKQAVRLTNSALVTEGLYSYVFVETAPRNFVKRRVKLAVQDREYSYVSEGVAKGERVVVGGALLLQSEMASTN